MINIQKTETKEFILPNIYLVFSGTAKILRIFLKGRGLFQKGEIFFDILVFFLKPVLHNKTRVVKRNNFFEEPVLLIKLRQVFKIFACTQAPAFIPAEAQLKLAVYCAYNESFSCLYKLRAVIVIVVFLPALFMQRYKTQRAYRVDIKLIVKFFNAAVSHYHIIYKYT